MKSSRPEEQQQWIRVEDTEKTSSSDQVKWGPASAVPAEQRSTDLKDSTDPQSSGQTHTHTDDTDPDTTITMSQVEDRIGSEYWYSRYSNSSNSIVAGSQSRELPLGKFRQDQFVNSAAKGIAASCERQQRWRIR